MATYIASAKVVSILYFKYFSLKTFICLARENYLIIMLLCVLNVYLQKQICLLASLAIWKCTSQRCPGAPVCVSNFVPFFNHFWPKMSQLTSLVVFFLRSLYIDFSLASMILNMFWFSAVNEVLLWNADEHIPRRTFFQPCRVPLQNEVVRRSKQTLLTEDFLIQELIIQS